MALEKNLVTPETLIKDIPRKIKCSIHNISDLKQFPKDLSVEEILIRSSNIGTLILAKKVGQQEFKNFIRNTSLLSKPELELEELGTPLNFKWNKCKLETISYGHGIAITPLQATATYAALTNGGYLIKPTIIKKENFVKKKKIISEQTSKKVNNILRQVVTHEEGTASLADVYGFDVGGKTGTSQKYNNENKNLNTFISIFPLKSKICFVSNVRKSSNCS